YNLRVVGYFLQQQTKAVLKMLLDGILTVSLFEFGRKLVARIRSNEGTHERSESVKVDRLICQLFFIKWFWAFRY
ncbi:MAG: hypothetical protein WB664_04800, partial [Nitrososphaeraceae archaeon]